ncbi:MAG: hypothetical protein HN348_10210 [Proteobacteria bacterium]|jgi:hypothetical protein|nr:hypothetical protein [Pseudomonadota bacterium]
MRLSMSPLAVTAFIFLTGCPEQGQMREICSESFDTLDGSTYVMLEAMPDKSEVPNPMARMKFYKEEGNLKVKYTAKSLGDVFTYECAKRGTGDKEELVCKETPRLVEWCTALLVYESDSCTVAKLKEMGAENVPDDKIKAAIKEAQADFDKNKDNARYRLMNNNLGNALQGLLFVSVNNKRCNLMIDDMYMTMYNGNRVEDYNPVGKNPFVKSDESYLFEHCEDAHSIVDLDSDKVPKDLSKIDPSRFHLVDQQVYYHYVGGEVTKAEEECTYSYDTYAQWEPVAKQVGVVPNEKGELNWTTAHTFKEDGRVQVQGGQWGGVYHIIRQKECKGKKETIDVICNSAPIRTK